MSSPLTRAHPRPPSRPHACHALMGGPEGTVVLLSALTAGGAPCILAVAWSTIHCTTPSSSRGNGRAARRRWLASPGLCTLCMATAGYGFSWGTQAGAVSSPGQHSDPAGPAHPCRLPYVLVELLRQFLDVTQDPLRVVLIRPHPSHLVGHQLGEEAGSGSWPGRQGGRALLPAGRGRTSSNRSVAR